MFLLRRATDRVHKCGAYAHQDEAHRRTKAARRQEHGRHAGRNHHSETKCVCNVSRRTIQFDSLNIILIICDWLFRVYSDQGCRQLGRLCSLANAECGEDAGAQRQQQDGRTTRTSERNCQDQDDRSLAAFATTTTTTAAAATAVHRWCQGRRGQLARSHATIRLQVWIAQLNNNK